MLRPSTPRASGARLAVAGMVAALGLALAATPAGAALPGSTADIAFAAPTPAERSGPSTTTMLRSVPGAGDAAAVSAGSSPAWSPDGTQLVLVQDGRLVVAQADGSSMSTLAIAGATDLADPQWSPDGEQLVFTGYPARGDSLTDVYTAAADGSGVVDLTESERTIEADPTWSPDGRTIFYAATVLPADDPPDLRATGRASRSADTTSALRSISPDGTGAATLAGTYDAADPDVSPDGRYVLFATPDALLTYDRSTRRVRWLIDAADLSEPAFSPDCTQVGFTRSTGEAATTDLESVTLATGTVTPLAPSAETSAELAWQRGAGPVPTCTLPGPTAAPAPVTQTPLADHIRLPTASAPIAATPAPADTTPPVLSIGATSKQLALARRHGVRVAYRVNERVRIRADVMLTSMATAPALTYATAPAAGPGRALASADVTRLPGDNALRIQFNYRALKVLRPFLKLTVNVRLIATDAAGNETTVVRKITLRNPY